jgi:hypothetical protein
MNTKPKTFKKTKSMLINSGDMKKIKGKKDFK